MGLGCRSFPCIGCRVCNYLVGLMLSCFGHTRAKKNSESPCWLEFCSPFLFGVVTLLSSSSSQSCELFVLLWYVVVSIRTAESRIRGWVCLRKLVFGATQIELDYWLSTPQPLKSIGKGSQGLRDCEAEKGLIPSVGCVDVLKVRLTLVYASLVLHWCHRLSI